MIGKKNVHPTCILFLIQKKKKKKKNLTAPYLGAFLCWGALGYDLGLGLALLD